MNGPVEWALIDLVTTHFYMPGHRLHMSVVYVRKVFQLPCGKNMVRCETRPCAVMPGVPAVFQKITLKKTSFKLQCVNPLGQPLWFVFLTLPSVSDTSAILYCHTNGFLEPEAKIYNVGCKSGLFEIQEIQLRFK
jgi:hypothetical protein